MYYDEGAFFEDYGMLFSALHPEVEIEVISTRALRHEEGKDMDEEMIKFIEENKPDVLMLSPSQFTKLARDGKLLELDHRVEEKDFRKEGLLPGLLDYMREMGGGKLYGLIPYYDSQVLFYNKDLFEKYSVEPPRDKMSWEDVFRLAAMFPTDGEGNDRVYGLSLGYGYDLFSLGSLIAHTYNLKILNPQTQQVTIHSESWKKVYEMAQKALQEGYIYRDNPYEKLSGEITFEDHILMDPFVGGKVAMATGSYYMIEQIKRAREAVPDRAVKNWDIVTMPVDPMNPDYSPHVSLWDIFAISSSAAEADAAWKFVKYIHSDEYARVTSKRQRGGIPVRTQYLKDNEGHNIAAFYALRPSPSSLETLYEGVPNEFWMNFYSLASQELKEVEEGRKTVSEALDSLQIKAQEALVQAHLKKESEPSSS